MGPRIRVCISSGAVMIATGLLGGCAAAVQRPAPPENTLRGVTSKVKATESTRVTRNAPGSVHHEIPADPEASERTKNDRAISAMRQAIALYEKFIQRAADDPDMAQAILRSRERIEELRQTIAVLESWR